MYEYQSLTHSYRAPITYSVHHKICRPNVETRVDFRARLPLLRLKRAVNSTGDINFKHLYVKDAMYIVQCTMYICNYYLT